MLSKEELELEYVTKNRTATEIGKDCQVTDGAVRIWLKKYGIPIKPRGGNRQTKSLIGQKFGEYTVLSQAKPNGHWAIWKCQCSCGRIKEISSPRLREGDAKSCGECLNHWNWKGYEEIGLSYFHSLQKGAKKRNREFNLTIEEMWDLFLKQDRKCALTGVELSFEQDKTQAKKTASLDRIDSKKGYTLDNIQWVHKIINIMKQRYSQTDFIYWCKQVTEFNK